MSFYNKVIKYNKILKRSYDYYYHMYFCFISTFIGSLIQRGLRMKAFNKFLHVKYVLKIKESLDPFVLLLICFLKITPSIYFLPMRMGRIVQGIPLPIFEQKQIVYAVK